MPRTLPRAMPRTTPTDLRRARGLAGRRGKTGPRWANKRHGAQRCYVVKGAGPRRLLLGSQSWRGGAGARPRRRTGAEEDASVRRRWCAVYVHGQSTSYMCVAMYSVMRRVAVYVCLCIYLYIVVQAGTDQDKRRQLCGARLALGALLDTSSASTPLCQTLAGSCQPLRRIATHCDVLQLPSADVFRLNFGRQRHADANLVRLHTPVVRKSIGRMYGVHVPIRRWQHPAASFCTLPPRR